MPSLPLLTGVLLLSLFACIQTADAKAKRPAATPKSEVQAIVTRTAKAHGVPTALALGVAHVESGYRCGARGRAGERGAMQVKPATARSVGVTGNLFNCATGIEAGMRYLKLALAKANGDWCRAASYYNRGIYAKATCSRYGKKVVAMAKRFSALA